MSTLPAYEPSCIDPADARAIDVVIEARARAVGTLTVARVLPAAKRRMVGPFVFLDHLGPIALAPGVGFGIAPHPHIGLSTVTYMLAGEQIHRDSLGSVQPIRPGDVNLMTAGRGIVHSERADPAFRDAGGALHVVQIWLGLPEAHEDDEPSFEHHPQATLPAIAPAPGVRGRVLAGSAFGGRSPIRHPSDPLLVDLELAAGAAIELAADVAERALFVASGELVVGDQKLVANQLAVLCSRATRVSASADARALVPGGPALPPRFIDWNFVSSRRDAIDRARDAWKARSFPTIPTDSVEFVPYPDR
jgi:redox-sensitive bicupin YhaK (pirin superfamily)